MAHNLYLDFVDAPGTTNQWNVVRRSGDVVEQILAEAEKAQTSMISMSTAWQRPVLGMVDGGVTERVLRGAGCPVAAVPVESG